VLAGALTLSSAVGVATALPNPSAHPAQNTNPATVSTVARRCTNAITARFNQLDQLLSQMNSDKSLDPAHHSALSDELGRERSGLTDLEGQIQSATTLAQLATLCPKIVTDYRVYVLETPKVHLVMAADRETTTTARLGDIGNKLNAAITTAQEHGKDVTQAHALYADFSAKVADANAKAGGVPGAVLPLTPAGYNAGTARPVLTSSRDALVAGRADLLAAQADAQQIVTILKSFVSSGPTATTATS
jgi:hypothetical protein